MFETNEESEIAINHKFGPIGRHLWRSVELRMIKPWFFVERSVEPHRDALISMLMLTDPVELLNLIQKENVKIYAMYLVLPGDQNKTDNWTMERIKKIWVGEGISCGNLQRIFQFEVTDGTQYFDPQPDATTLPLQNLTSIY